MPELITLLIIVTLSLLVVRIGARALEMTGLSRESASFQSQSAFMGVGFTTSEAEFVVDHPVRRQIIRLLMLLGFGAITSTLGTLVITFARDSGESDDLTTKIGVLALGLVVLLIGTRVRPLERLLDRAISRALEEWTELRVVDYEGLLNLNKGYMVATLPVDDVCWMTGRTLREMGLADEGVLILNVIRENGVVIATPASTTRLQEGDRVLAYGREEDLTRLRKRRSGADGDKDHHSACRKQKLRLVEERTEDQIADVSG